MDTHSPHEFIVHRPGGVSSFFVYKAGFMALAFWAWLILLATRSDQVSGWLVVAATGAVTTTLAGVGLGIRHALQRNAATRHEQIMKTLVDLSWTAFAAGNPADAFADGDASVIQLSPHESRPRPRR